MNKKEMSVLLVKQVRIMEEINKLDKILNEHIIQGIREASDFTEYIMDEIGLPDEGAECIATDDFEHLKNGNETFEYCRDWVYDTVYCIADDWKEDASVKIIALINEMEEHSTNIIMLKDKELLMEAGSKVIKKINNNIKN